MVLAYPGIVLVALIWILTPVVALPVAWVRWYRARHAHTNPGPRESIILKGLIAATIAFAIAAFLMIAADVNPNIQAEPTASRLAGCFSVIGFPAALFSIFAGVRGEGRGRLPLFLVGLTTGIYWFFGFISIFSPRWLR
jgi:hypothetical protein